MSKYDRWIPLDVGAYLADTMHLTTLQHGAYYLLLLHYWKTGPLPDDDGQLAAIARMEIKAWRAIRVVIRQFFTEKDGVLRQKRADQEREKTATISTKRSVAGKGGAQARWGQSEGKPPDKPGGKPIANATETDGKSIANGRQMPDVCHDFANTPVPSPKEFKILREEKEAAGARETEAGSIVRGVAKALKRQPEPFTPGRDFQLAALTTVSEKREALEPIRTPDEQLAILRGENAA